MTIPALLLAMAIAVEVPGRGAAWVDVVSVEGKFSVRMPQKANSFRKSGREGGVFAEQMFKSCRFEGALYVANKITVSPAPAGSDAEVLDQQRKAYVEHAKGKELDHKAIELDGHPGQEFTSQAPAPTGKGTIQDRTRIYRVNNAFLVLSVMSAVGKPLPPGTERFLNSLALRDGSRPRGVAKAAKPSGSGWGDAVDPDGDCKIAFESGAVSIRVPGKIHDLGKERNSPRVLRKVSGDFAVQVKVTGMFRPRGPSLSATNLPYNGAGLLLWASDDGNMIRLERAAILRDQQVLTAVNFERFERGERVGGGAADVPEGDCFLKLERRGGQVVGFASRDGRSWDPLPPFDVSWPAELKVGIAVVNNDSKALSARFEGFTTTKLETAEASKTPEKGTPEDAYRAFMIAVFTHDEATLRAVTLPAPGLAVLLRATKLTPQQIEIARKQVAAEPIRRLNAGDDFTLPNKRVIKIPPADVGPDRVVLAPQRAPIPVRCRKVDGVWKVDAGQIIAGRIAAEAAAGAKGAGAAPR